MWTVVNWKPDLPSQGWKLYVSIRADSFQRVIDVLLPYLESSGVAFKYLTNARDVWAANSGLHGYTQVGKNIVIYASGREFDDVFLSILVHKVRELEFNGPDVPRLPKIVDDLPLFYRYGAYKGEKIVIGGISMVDRRDSIEQSDQARGVDAPPWEGIGECSSRRTPKQIEALLCRYPAAAALRQSGKGGVFVAIDTVRGVTPVILKVGYKHGYVLPDGSDGSILVNREAVWYDRFFEAGLDMFVPKKLEFLDTDVGSILVLELIHGAVCSDLLDSGLFLDEHLVSLERLLEEVHAAGISHGDAKLANFAVDLTGRAKVLDLETCSYISQSSGRQMETYRFHGVDLDPISFDLCTLYASVLFPDRQIRCETDRIIDDGRIDAVDVETGVSRYARARLRDRLASGSISASKLSSIR